MAAVTDQQQPPCKRPKLHPPSEAVDGDIGEMTPDQAMQLELYQTLVETTDDQSAYIAPEGDDTVLQTINSHPRDARIVFQEDGHVYILDGEALDLSVSGLWSRYFVEFDSEDTLNKYFDGWVRNKRSKYHHLIMYMRTTKGMDEQTCKAEIAKMWTANGNRQSALGTLMHRQIELYLNTRLTVTFPAWHQQVIGEDMSPELEQFGEWIQEEILSLGWTPYRTEWSVFDEDAMVAGQIDSLWITPSGEYVMVDWKRCSSKISPRDKNNFTPWGISLCANVKNTSYGHYCIQQNAYAYILKKRYNMQVAQMFLAQFHPNQKQYNLVKVEDVQCLVHAMFEARIKEVQATKLRAEGE